MKKHFENISSDAHERQEARFDIWKAGEGVPFIDEAAKAAYQERVCLMKDAIQLMRAPGRIPVCPSAGFFPLAYARTTMYEAMYDFDALGKAWETYHDDFAPDAYNGPINIVPGRVLDILDFKLYHWPGHGVSKGGEYQFIENEYMRANEYMDLIDDPTGFFMNTYFPRIFGGLKSLTHAPLMPPVHELPLVPPAVMPFGAEEMQTAFKKLHHAGKEALHWREKVGMINGNIMGKGFPAFSGGFTKAPFDVIGDSLRGTRGVMLDMFKQPGELMEACERLTPIMVKCGVNACRSSGHVMPFIPLHKGADGFMSDEMFGTFYWPTLRKLIIGLVNNGLVPLLFAEGSYNHRLDVISDLPKGKAVWWFDRTDMIRAKKTVGRVSCIAGNFPLSLLCTATVDEIKKHCRKLFDDMGTSGFIFSTGAGMQGAQVENVKAVIRSAKEYSGTNN